MSRMRGLLLAGAVVAALAVAALPAPQAQPANRAPHPILGPDQTVRDSADTCAPPGILTGCTRIDVNFNQSWDPDPNDSLAQAGAYAFTSTAVTPNGPPCTPALAWTQVTGERGRFFSYAPVITDVHVTQCRYAITVTVDDGHGAANNCCATSRINVTVLNGASPPRFDCLVSNPNQCDPAAITIYSFNRDMFGRPPSARGKVNLADDRMRPERPKSGNIWFEAHNVTDDKAVATLQIYLDLLGDQDQVMHRIAVPLQKQCSDRVRFVTSVDCFPYSQAPERTTWNGTLAVDTPELITGSYAVWARAFDRDGLNTTFPLGKVTLEVEAPDGDCHPLVASGGVPPCIKLNRPQTASNIPGTCFAGEANARMNVPPLPRDRLSFGLGEGETLRPQIQGPYPTENEPGTTPPRPYVFTDPNLLLWKVTYQTCIEGPVQAGQCAGRLAATTCPHYGPEVVLDPPYFMALDTLFNAAVPIDQDVALRAYDRLGKVNGTAFHLVTDTERPTYLIDRPDLTFQGIPFQFTVLVHDRIDTEVTLHIDDFAGAQPLDNRTASCQMAQGACTGQSPPPGNLTLASGKQVGLLNVVRVPRLASAVAYDVGGPHDGTAPCSYLFDANGDAILDTILDPRSMTVTGRLLATQSDQGDYNDYVLDLDGDGLLTENELIIRGTPSGRPADAGRCDQNVFASLAARQFLADAPTQVFAFTLVRDTLGNASYRFTIRDVVFNNNAAPFCDPDCAGVPANSTLQGTFTTIPALVDARIVNITASPGPALPGDPIWVNATIEERSPQQPEPSAPLLFVLDREANILNGTFECPPESPESPVLRVTASCQFLVPARFSLMDDFLRALLGLNPEEALGECPVPSDPMHDFFVCVKRPDLRDPRVMVGYPPGRHTLTGVVVPSPAVLDIDLSNNLAPVSFEVYLGKVVHGSVDGNGRATGSGKEYYIRADPRGYPLLTGGAVRVGPNGVPTASYDLRFLQEPDLRYEFTVDGTTLHYDPQAKRAVSPALCGLPANATLACTRPITVIPVTRGTSSTTQASPDAGLAIPVVLALAALAVRRRRA